MAETGYERSLNLVRAYSDAYTAAGGDDLPETDAEVLVIIERHGARTVEQAAAAGQQDAHGEANLDDDPGGP